MALHTEDDYEIISQRDVDRLKKELAELKKAGTSREGKIIQESMEKLNDNILSLTEIFKESAMELKLSDNEAFNPRMIRDLAEKVETLADQNTKIAEAILAVAEISNEIKNKFNILSQAIEEMNKPLDEDNGMMEQDNFNPYGQEQMGGMPQPMFNQQMGPPPMPMNQPPSQMPPLNPPPFNPQNNMNQNSQMGMPPPPPPAPPEKKPMFTFK
jgi:uncharacterized phage infection (PIP) family protein YhgE